jgi:hypothetical protein
MRPIRYACPYCNTVYKTLREARACSRPIKDDFKRGDIVWFHGRVWRVLDTDQTFSVERVPEYLRAFGWWPMHRSGYQMMNACYPKDRYCKSSDLKHFTVKEAKAKLKERAIQYHNAQVFFSMLKEDK